VQGGSLPSCSLRYAVTSQRCWTGNRSRAEGRRSERREGSRKHRLHVDCLYGSTFRCWEMWTDRKKGGRGLVLVLVFVVVPPPTAVAVYNNNHGSPRKRWSAPGLEGQGGSGSLNGSSLARPAGGCHLLWPRTFCLSAPRPTHTGRRRSQPATPPKLAGRGPDAAHAPWFISASPRAPRQRSHFFSQCVLLVRTTPTHPTYNPRLGSIDSHLSQSLTHRI
jgi:hypothetical protein